MHKKHDQAGFGTHTHNQMATKCKKKETRASTYIFFDIENIREREIRNGNRFHTYRLRSKEHT